MAFSAAYVRHVLREPSVRKPPTASRRAVPQRVAHEGDERGDLVVSEGVTNDVILPVPLDVADLGEFRQVYVIQYLHEYVDVVAPPRRAPR